MPSTDLASPRFMRSSDDLVADIRQSGQTSLLITTNQGLEDVVIDEFKTRPSASDLEVHHAESRPLDLNGYVALTVEGSRSEILHHARQLRSAHHLLEVCARLDLPPTGMLDALYDAVASVDLPMMEAASSFRVTTVRTGTHDFTSIDAQRVAGAALEAKYGTAVDLENYDLEVRVDVHGRQGLVSIQHTRDALSQRHARLFESPAALKPNVAYALLHLLHLEEPPEVLLDPFCGSGTILLEAAACWPHARLVGSDWSEAAVEGTRRNAAAQNVAERIAIRRADVRHLRDTFPELRVDAVVTNPPFGERVGKAIHFPRFYQRMLEQTAALLNPGGRLVLLTTQPDDFGRAVQKAAFDIRHVRVIQVSGLYPRAFVLERT